MPSLSFQRAYYGEGEDDWQWMRWLWSRPGADEFKFWHAYGFSLWETDVDRSASQVGIPLNPSTYAPSRVSVEDGFRPRGPVEWWEDGPPVESLQGHDAFATCAGEGWDTDTTVTIITVVDEPEGEIVLRGGLSLGGSVYMEAPCWVPYGSCLHPAGGLSLGGRLELRGFTGVELRGRLSLGGALRMVGGSRFHLAGGLSAGGRLRMPNPGVGMEAGLSLGGRLSLVGSTLCPTFLGAQGSSINPSADIAVPFPFPVADSDLVAVVVMQEMGAAVIGLNAGWTHYATRGTGPGSPTADVFVATYGPGLFPCHVTYDAAGALYGVGASIRHPGTLVVGDRSFGGTSPARTAPVWPTDHSELLVVVLQLGTGFTAWPPALTQAGLTGPEMPLWYQDAYPGGSTGRLAFAYSGPGPWMALPLWLHCGTFPPPVGLFGLAGGVSLGGPLTMTPTYGVVAAGGMSAGGPLLLGGGGRLELAGGYSGGGALTMAGSVPVPYVVGTSINAPSSGSTWHASIPAGLTVGDRLYLVVASYFNGCVIGAPAGWNLIYNNHPLGTTQNVAVWERGYTAGMAAPNGTLSSNSTYGANIVAVRGGTSEGAPAASFSATSPITTPSGTALAHDLWFLAVISTTGVPAAVPAGYDAAWPLTQRINVFTKQDCAAGPIPSEVISISAGGAYRALDFPIHA